MADRYMQKQSATISQHESGVVASLMNFPMTPYVLGVFVWLLAWWVQMGPLRPLFNFAPGVELPFFPAGVRTLAVFAFGFAGAVGIFIGSVVTYFLYFPEMGGVSSLGVLGCAASSAFSSYLAMRFVCDLRGIPGSMSGLTLGNIGWIVITQSVLSATLHQFCYFVEGMVAVAEQPSLGNTLFYWGAMATGDALGSMAVLLAVLVGFQVFRKIR